MSGTIILVPGYTNSGPEHWQSYIERKFKNVLRVEQLEWDNPVRSHWIAGLEQTIASTTGELFLVGHSCGAMAITQWSEHHFSPRVKGALLVAPADVDADSAPLAIQVQRPVAQTRLPFPSTLVYSDNDPYLSVERAKIFANNWASKLIEIPDAGHIHTAAGFGEWPAGEQLVIELCGFELESR